MQALIDFDGWRKWKDFSQQTQPSAASGGKAAGSSGHVHKGSFAGAANSKAAVGTVPGGKMMGGGAGRRDKRLSAGTVGTGAVGTAESEVEDSAKDVGRGGAIVAGA